MSTTKSGQKEGKIDAESLMAEYEGLRGQTEILKESLDMINSNLTELSVVRESLSKLGEMPADNEILVPMGGDSFTKAKITDKEKVIVGIGSNVAVGKSIPVALEDLEKQIKGLEKARDEGSAEFQKSVKKLEELTPTVQAILSQLTKKG